MFCSKCGTENREGARFCMSCAAPLSVIIYEKHDSQMINSQGWGVICVVIAIIAFFSVALFFRQDPATTLISQTSSPPTADIARIPNTQSSQPHADDSATTSDTETSHPPFVVPRFEQNNYSSEVKSAATPKAQPSRPIANDTHSTPNAHPSRPLADQAYRQVLAIASGKTEPKYLDELYDRIENTAYRYSIIPEFALAVVAAEARYGKGISFARHDSWQLYEATTHTKMVPYPAVLSDLDTALSELRRIMSSSEKIEDVFEKYWCGNDGKFNSDSVNTFSEAASKLWNGLEPYARERMQAEDRGNYSPQYYNPSPNQVTLAEFDTVRMGMLYYEVCIVVGGEGNLITESIFGDTTYRGYLWSGTDLISNMTATFKNGILYSKSQILLK